MVNQKLLKHIVFLMLFMFLADYLAKEFYWYYTVWYFDVIMHFLGGFWVGLFFIYVSYRKNLQLKSILNIILYVLLVGVLWEVFEFYVYQYLSGNPFNIIDTTSDILLDIAGGFVAVFYFLKKIMPSDKNNVQLN